MVHTKASVNDFIVRLTNRKANLTAVRKSWRRKNKTSRPKKTPYEKAFDAAARKKKRTEYLTCLEEARQIVQHEASVLHEKFGRHSEDYYTEAIIQGHSQHKNKRNISLWNAHVHQQSMKHNNGT